MYANRSGIWIHGYIPPVHYSTPYLMGGGEGVKGETLPRGSSFRKWMSITRHHNDLCDIYKLRGMNILHIINYLPISCYIFFLLPTKIHFNG